MKRPYTIVHFISSVNGRISGDDFLLPDMEPIHDANFGYRRSLDCDAVLNGTTTCAEIYSDGYLEPDTCEPETAGGRGKIGGAKDNILFKEGNKCCICIDPEGILSWSRNYVDRDVMPRSHVVEVLTGKVRASFVEHLDELGISYIFAGDDEIDLELMMEKLYSYGIRKVLVTGGGMIDYALLMAGLVDEVSIVIAPIVAADKEQATGFDMSPFAGGEYGRMLKLKSFEELKDGSVLIRYMKGEQR